MEKYRTTYGFDTPNFANILLCIGLKFQVLTKALLSYRIIIPNLDECPTSYRLCIRNVDKCATFYRFVTLRFHKRPTL